MLGIVYAGTQVPNSLFRVEVQVQPNAKRDEITGFDEGILKIKITASPVKGKANKSLIDFLGKVLKLKKSHITIEKGKTSRRKILAIEGIDQTGFQDRINLWNNRY